MADRYLLETGAPDGYQLEDGSGVLLLETEVVTSNGWFSPLSVAPKRNWVPQPELRAFGVALAAAAVATTGWFQPLSKAVARPAVHVGSTFVPFDTRQVNTQTIDKWLVPLSVAVAAPPVWQGGPSYEFRSTQFTQNTVYWGNYQQPLSTAVPRPPVQQGHVSWVGQPLAGNNVDISKWQQPLGKAAATPPVWPGQSFVPFNTAQIIQNTVTIDKWQQPLSQAVPRPPVWVGNSFVPYNTAQVVAANIYGWWQPASVAPPPRPPIKPELRPFAAKETAVVVSAAVYGWWPTSDAAPTPRPRPPQQSVSIAYPLPDDQHIRWHQPLSRAVAIPRTVPQGWTFVPLNTAQVVAAAQYGWWPATSKAPPPRPQILPELRPFAAIQTVETAVYGWWQPLSRAVAIPYRTFTQGLAFVPYNTAQVVAANYGWWPELSRAASRPPVQQGGASYTFLSTQFTQNTVYWGNYQQPLSRAVPAPPVWQGATSVPYNTAQVVVAANYGWWPELSRAVTRPPVRQGGAFWVGQPLAGNNVDLGKWQQPLSRAAARLAPAWWGGPTYVFRSTQFTQNTVYWGNYQQPLSRPLARLPVQLGYSYVPFNTAQVQRARNYGYIVG